MKNNFEIREIVDSLLKKGRGIVISYSKTILCDEQYVYSVFFYESKEYIENIFEGDLIKLNED
jgi:hypothetical protein